MESNPASYTLTPVHIKLIECVLMQGSRVEIIPVKDGIKIMKVERRTIKP
jgi:hypothetical protein